jgi:carboxymethylenebutenolidase
MKEVVMEEVRFPASGGHRMRALLVRGAADDPRPGVLLLHELVGFRHPGIVRIARRLAREGYVALIPDLYDRPGPFILCIARMMRSLKRGEGEGFNDLEAARAWLASLPEVDESRIGVAGFCLGGGFAILYAARAPVGAAAVFYGIVPKAAAELEGICPVVASYGGKDRVFATVGDRLEEHLRTLGVPHDVKTYPTAGHAFMDPPDGLLAAILRISPFRVAYDEEASEDSWRRLLGFFEEHLGAMRRPASR